MARISKGILGGVSGGIGTVVGATWKGIPYLRSKGERKKRIPTPAQQAQRLRFAVGMGFIRPLSKLLETTFYNVAHEMTGINSALGYTIKHALVGEYPNYSIDYSHTMIARGDLPAAKNPSVIIDQNGIASFSWENNSGLGTAADTDRSILVAFCPQQKQGNYILSGSVRSSLSATLDISAFKDSEIFLWIAFISADGKEVSDSQYLINVGV